MKENLIVYIDYFPVKHAALRFSATKMSHKKERKRVTPGRIDISGTGPISCLFRSSMYYIVVSTNSLS